MTVVERRHEATHLHWTCEACGHEAVFASRASLRSAQTQHNSPRITSARAGVDRSPCEAMRIDEGKDL